MPFQDYIAGTYLQGMGAAVAALSNHPILMLKIFGVLGRLARGIYAIHFAFVDMLRQSFKAGTLPWGYFLAALVLSVAAATILSKHRLPRSLVI